MAMARCARTVGQPLNPQPHCLKEHIMKIGLLLSAVAAVSLAACSALPGGAKPAEDHSAHQTAASAAPHDMSQMEGRMKRMHEMHAKMQAAKTPEERAALMEDHKKAMQDGMAGMGPMKGGMGGGMGMKPPASEPAQPMMDHGKAGGHHELMVRRMDRMEMMMQMMMDREGVKPPAGK
jgi:hypothetical protein